jgi:uncharacterized phage-associated protein
MANNTEKTEVFEYILFKLLNWSKEINPNRDNDLSKLKVIKLHFFVSSVNSSKNTLLNLFDKFYAMPYGHVESEIYNNVNSLERFTISKSKTEINNSKLLENSFENLNAEYKLQVDDAIASLKKNNPLLINYSALELVDLSHMYFSWQTMFNLARSRNKFSESIPSQLIKDEPKYFFINN